MNLQELYFNSIKNGEKFYEIRLNDEKRKAIKTDDTITFSNAQNPKEKILTAVKNLIYFKSFEEMCQNLPLNQIGFKNQTPQEVIDIYHQFYNIEDEFKYGVVAIKIKVIN
jgi:ASC-1-like (ASCH) protein